MKSLISIVLIGLLGLSLDCQAQTAPTFPCSEDERYRAFDFWVGEWDVHDSAGNFAGNNAISRDEEGCVLVEKWVGGSGVTGQSVNYLDGVSGDWVQVWNSAPGVQIHIRGGLTDEGMLLVGKIHYLSNGNTADFRGLWTLLEDGRVRQFFEQYDTEAETWNPWFEGFYTRKTAP
ncbi:MAG: hypothetical protein AAF351_07715 [Pseudomonadota bacterium]